MWINSQHKKSLANRFRALVEANEILQIPGAHDAMAFLLRKIQVFKFYLSGAAYTASKGLPDLGIVTSTEVAERARDLVRAYRFTCSC